MIEKAFAHHALDWRYLTVEVHPESLGDAVRGMKAMGFLGGHCGNPHKREIVPLMDRATDVAAMVGAVNVILREGDQLVGDNSEGKGLTIALGRVTDPKQKRIVLLGAGNAARADAVELAAAGAAAITIVDRTEEHAKVLAALLGEKFPLETTALVWEGEFDVPEGTDILVNAAALDRDDADAPLPIRVAGLRPGMIVADMTADPPQTWLLREAAERGCPTVDGLTMYIDQVALALKTWTGVDPNLDVMREAIEEFLEV
jgi:shikimate dehydrogenase